jgi:histidyl-tRNA synthetase
VSELLRPPRGTFDILPEQAPMRRAVVETARAILEGAGYRRIETPAFEATELFTRTVGDATDIVQKEMYTFEDGGGRSLTLRPEVTAPVMRAYLDHGMHKLPQPVKLWYASSCWRYERAQSGRYRQFWQVGAEAIGSDDPAVDAEAIILLARILVELGVSGLVLRVASLGDAESRATYRELLRNYLKGHEDRLSEEVRGRLDANPMRAFDSDHEGTREVMAGAPLLSDHISEADTEHFAEVLALLDAAGVTCEVDPTLVRGLDYYTRTVFEFSSEALGAQSGVAGGGRYDGLAGQIGGDAVPGMGWAAGIERIILAAEERPEPEPVTTLFVAVADDSRQTRLGAFALACEARSAGVATQMELAGRSLKGQRKQANRVGARFTAVVGSDGIVLEDHEAGESWDEESSSSTVASVLRERGLVS